MNTTKILCALFVMTLAGAAAAQEEGRAVQEKEKGSGAPSFLFVQNAKGTEVKEGTLTLTGISPTTVYFSDRPKRMAGHIHNEGFVRHWAKGKDSFEKDPPNATLSSFGPEGKSNVAVVALKNPRLEGSNLTYDVRVLSGKLPTESSESALFIDDARWSSCDVGRTYEGAPCWADEAFSSR